MRIAVIGAGGVGGYFGGKLAAGGADVRFLARGRHLEAMRERGLAIHGPGGVTRVERVAATDDPTAIGEVDLVMFAVKLWDTESAITALRSIIGPDTAVISFQNGVLKDEILRASIPERQLMGGVCYVATTIAAPGVIKQTGPLERLVFGEFDGVRSPRAEAFLAACMAGGINAEIAPDVRRAIWEKFVFLVGLSGTTATMGATIGPIRSNAQTRAFLLDLMREVVAVGRAAGVALPEDYAEQRLALADGVDPAMTSSLAHDLQRGNRLEVRWLAGGVVELGAKYGVPTPLNRAVADILALREGGRPR